MKQRCLRLKQKKQCLNENKSEVHIPDMLTEKEQHIIKALVEDELSTAKESIITSDVADPVVLEYVDTLSDIRRKFTKTFTKHPIIK